MDQLVETLNKHKARLLSLAGCTGVAIGYKEVRGEVTDRLAIVLFVKKKLDGAAANDLIPAMLDGIPTDVVERTFGSKKLGEKNPSQPTETAPSKLGETDPFARFSQVFSGISIGCRGNPEGWGTFGCIIRTGGNRHVVAGDYLLTNQHVLWYADPKNPNSNSRKVIQPGRTKYPARPDYSCGDYVYGVEDEKNDCAIATIGDGRTWKNEVPDLSRLGRQALSKVGVAKVGDEVYKYGSTTQLTLGVVKYLHQSTPTFDDAIYIESPGKTMWCAQGDSGSVLIRYRDHVVLGLNFAADDKTILPPNKHPVLPDKLPAYWAGYAYDIQLQMDNFGHNPILAPNK